ncbi:hypothetical protein NOG12_01705 [Pseudidiomarina sp. GXY010]|uniref:Uncharacterized protein n=1 Tax=Pseudidiomarina fusca TaxID=2965078 RepID=A0ABU3KTK2_9GAMM|nr:hypothetical protein [Pseudidiomarina sp. GXY010]MDT7524814.1 hypothetical protein [Pseudidiomarina sp. GXY010]
MTYLDVLALSEEVERDSQSGKLSSELLAQGQTRYGNMADYPDHLVRTTPDGKKSLGHCKDGEFAEELLSAFRLTIYLQLFVW